MTIATFLPTIVDGHPGRLANGNCYDAFVFIGKRVYVFSIFRPDQEPLFRAFLSKVTFQASAPSGSSGASASASPA